MADPRHTLGRTAEQVTATWLSHHGWTVLATRCRPGAGGELDLISIDPDGVLVGVEVRARRTNRTGSAAASVDRGRVARLRLALASYAVASGATHRGLRLDLVTAERGDAQPGVPRAWRLTRLPGIG